MAKKTKNSTIDEPKKIRDIWKEKYQVTTHMFPLMWEILLSITWGAFCFLVLFKDYKTQDILAPNHLSALLLPLLVIWGILYIIKQQKTLKQYTETLHNKLDLLAYPEILASSCATGIENALAQQSETLQKLTKETTQNLTPLIESIKIQNHTFELIRDKNKELSSDINSSILRLDNILETLASKREEINHAANEHANDLQHVWTDIVEKSEGIHGMLRIQTHEAQDICDQIKSTTENLKSEYHTQIEVFKQNIEETSKKFENSKYDLNNHIELIQKETLTLSEALQETVNYVEDKIHNRTIDITNVLQQTVTHMEDNIHNRSLAVKDTMLQHTNELDDICKTLEAKITSSMSVFGHQKQEFQHMGHQFVEQLENDTKTIIKNTYEHIGNMSNVLDQQHKTLAGMTEKMAFIAAQTTEQINKDTDSIYNTLKKESDLLENFIAHFKTQSQNVHHALSDQVNLLSKASVEAERQSDNVVKKIKQQTDALKETSQQTAHHFTKIADILDQESNVIGQTIQDSMTLFDMATNKFFQEGERMTHTSLQIGMQINDNNNAIKSQGDHVLHMAKEASDIFLSSADILKQNIHTLQSSIKQTSNQFEGLMEKMHNYSHDISTTSDITNQQLNTIGNNLAKQYNLFKETTSTIQHIFQNMSDQLNNKTQHFVKEFQQVSTITENTTKSFESQIHHLITSSKSAYNEAEKLQIHQEKYHRGLFIKAARFITEDLNSISIDITRLLDAKIPEMDWKRYIKGDRAVFTRSLVQNKQQKLAAMISKEIKHNNELRMYVTKYIQLFDKIIIDAQKVDPEWLLFSTFSTSDVGKLYSILSKSIGHDMPIQGDNIQIEDE